MTKLPVFSMILRNSCKEVMNMDYDIKPVPDFDDDEVDESEYDYSAPYVKH